MPRKTGAPSARRRRSSSGFNEAAARCRGKRGIVAAAGWIIVALQ